MNPQAPEMWAWVSKRIEEKRMPRTLDALRSRWDMYLRGEGSTTSQIFLALRDAVQEYESKFGIEYRIETPTKKEQTVNQNYPKAPQRCAAQAAPWQALPVMGPAVKLTAADIERGIADAQAALKKTREEEAEAAKLMALRERLNYEQDLASATCILLGDIANIRFNGVREFVQRNSFAKFQQKLAPIAKSYGFRIKWVGDKSVGVLTVI